MKGCGNKFYMPSTQDITFIILLKYVKGLLVISQQK